MGMNVSKHTDAHIHKIFVVSVPCLKLLVKQMAEARGSVHKFCSKCGKGEKL